MHVIISSCYTYWAWCKSWVEGINGLLWGSWIVLAPIHNGGREWGLEEAWLGAFKLHATLTPLVMFIGLDINLITCLDYGEEVHLSRISRQWSNMIGHKMGSSWAGVYTTMVKTSPVENFEPGWKNDMVINMTWLSFVFYQIHHVCHTDHCLK